MKLLQIATLAASAAAAPTTAWTGGPSYEITSTATALKITVTVPKNMYFSLAFGKGMSGVDSLWFLGR